MAESARSKELSWKTMSEEVKQLFLGSMAKEWSTWERFNAVKMVDQLPQRARAIGMRWVHTDKNAKLRLTIALSFTKTIEVCDCCLC